MRLAATAKRYAFALRGTTMLYPMFQPLAGIKRLPQQTRFSGLLFFVRTISGNRPRTRLQSCCLESFKPLPVASLTKGSRRGTPAEPSSWSLESAKLWSSRMKLSLAAANGRMSSGQFGHVSRPRRCCRWRPCRTFSKLTTLVLTKAKANSSP